MSRLSGVLGHDAAASKGISHHYCTTGASHPYPIYDRTYIRIHISFVTERSPVFRRDWPLMTVRYPPNAGL